MRTRQQYRREAPTSTPVHLWPSLALAFALELCAFAAFGAWAFQAGDRTWTSVVFAMLAVLAGALGWGLFASPRAPFSSPVLTPAVTVVFFGAAGVALLAIGHPWLAAGFLLLVVINTSLLHLVPRGTTAAESSTDPGTPNGPTSP